MKEIQTAVSCRKVALLSVMLLFLVGAAMATSDVTISGAVTSAYNNYTVIFSNEPNSIKVVDVLNNGPDTANDVVVNLYVSDVSSGTSVVATSNVGTLTNGAKTTVTLIDPTIRTAEGATISYTARVNTSTAESDYSNNDKTSANIGTAYNGYKGKCYWTGASDITTQHNYDLNGVDMAYYTQPSSAYKGVGWTTRDEIWTAANLPIPEDANIEAAWLYISYNWDTTSGGKPNVTASFNSNTLTLGTPYTDKSNMGTYGNYKYGLYPAIDVRTYFNANSDNTLNVTRNTGNSNALYPSTLVVVYRDEFSDTRKQIFINEECDELLLSDGYGVNLTEATAYAPFTGMTITPGSVQSATLYSFAGSAGTNEGNLLFNGNTVATNAWQGSSSTASPLIYNVPVANLTAAGNEAGIQGTQSGGMLALQQILVVRY